MELECWGLKAFSDECRQWHQEAFRHHLDGVRIAPSFELPRTVNIAHVFACGSVQAGGLANSRAVLSYLLDNGGDLCAPDINGWLPVNYAAWFGHAGTMDVLLELGSPVHNPISPQPLDTALAAVAQRNMDGAETCARLLLMHGADPTKGNVADPQYGGISWLVWALENERWEWAECLWAKGLRTMRDKELHLLVLRGGIEALAWAQYHGIDVLAHLSSNHEAYNVVHEVQAHVQREKLLEAVDVEGESGEGRRKL